MSHADLEVAGKRPRGEGAVRVRAIARAFRRALPRTISEDLLSATRQFFMGNRGANSPAHARLWFKALSAGQQDEALSMALCRVAGILGTASTVATYRNHFAVIAIQGQARTAKARILDRIIAVLDTREIAGKLLGDCTRADLLREAYRLDAVAADATLDAALYREIATLLGTETVRQYGDRGKIVALLTHRFD